MKAELRKWDIGDAENLARFADNPNVACNLRDAFPHPYTLEDARAYIQGCLSGDEARKLCRAIVVDGRTVGSIGVFLGSDVYRKSAELGYWLAEEYWRRGIMSAAVKRICREAFEKYDIVRIYAEPFAHNLGSRRVLENAGFTLEGVMKNGVFKKGKICDYCMYALFRHEVREIR